MVETIILVALAILLALANAGLALLPRKGKSGQVSVTFLPPSAAPLASSSSDAKLDAHISSSNQKISQLFLRVEKIEHSLKSFTEQTGMENNTNTPSDATWIQTVPFRKRRK